MLVIHRNNPSPDAHDLNDITMSINCLAAATWSCDALTRAPSPPWWWWCTAAQIFSSAPARLRLREESLKMVKLDTEAFRECSLRRGGGHQKSPVISRILGFMNDIEDLFSKRHLHRRVLPPPPPLYSPVTGHKTHFGKGHQYLIGILIRHILISIVLRPGSKRLYSLFSGCNCVSRLDRCHSLQMHVYKI